MFLHHLEKKLLLKIPIQSIKQINLENLDDEYRISFLDKYYSTLFIIDRIDGSIANNLFRLTSSFLQIEAPQVIQGEPPS